MQEALLKLVGMGGQAFTGTLVTGLAANNADLKQLLSVKNGFFAFESSLRVFPAGDSAQAPSLDEWNSRELWRYSYRELTDGMIFFAEDIFGTQFCKKEGGHLFV